MKEKIISQDRIYPHLNQSIEQSFTRVLDNDKLDYLK